MEEIELYDEHWGPRLIKIQRYYRIEEAVDKTLQERAITKKIRRGLRNLMNQQRGGFTCNKPLRPAFSVEQGG